jgi:hypothetical protein
MKILYLGGYSRSGSTLLGRVLGEASNTICIGETRFLWSRGLIDNVDCGCGTRFRSCPFWSAVGALAFGSWEQVDARHLAEVDRVTNLLAALPAYLTPQLRPRLGAMIGEYVDHLTRLYAAIARVSGASTIIEMSKHPTFACLLLRMPASDVRILHLVRDSRAVAYSWTRHKELSSPIGGKPFMPKFGVSDTATKWLAWNMVFHALSLGPTPYLRLTYEGFVGDPWGALEQISGLMDEPLLPAAETLKENEVRLSEHHMFSGNPMREKTGWVPIRLDNEWQTKFSAGPRARVNAITWPLLSLYGYPVFGNGARTS